MWSAHFFLFQTCFHCLLCICIFTLSYICGWSSHPATRARPAPQRGQMGAAKVSPFGLASCSQIHEINACMSGKQEQRSNTSRAVVLRLHPLLTPNSICGNVALGQNLITRIATHVTVKLSLIPMQAISAHNCLSALPSVHLVLATSGIITHITEDICIVSATLMTPASGKAHKAQPQRPSSPSWPLDP